MDLDIDHLRGWIGNSETMSERLTPQLVERFNATLDIEEDAVAGAEAPQMIHLCLAQPVAPASRLGHDGHPKRGGFLPPVSLPRRMWAGGEITFHAPLVIDEMVTRTSRIDDVEVKQGRSGTLCFVTVIHEYTCGGALAVRERQDVVYREAPTGGTPTAAADPAPAGTTSRQVTADATMLFRYSAITFNGHRIHYDAPYAREVEGYSGLVVQVRCRPLDGAYGGRHSRPGATRFTSAADHRFSTMPPSCSMPPRMMTGFPFGRRARAGRWRCRQRQAGHDGSRRHYHCRAGTGGGGALRLQQACRCRRAGDQDRARRGISPGGMILW
ncbi:MAG: hypothetical protein CM15mP115_25330 [Alphaproteobacteria bacterium]|nr:MAG: hypothetical protein CM15mP115_25330 [Alphaproteobacteria bacterium]